MIDYFAARLGFIRLSSLKEKLQFARSVGKRLDEHREVVEQIERSTTFFHEHPWHAGHMGTQDDYLMRLYHLVYGCWPDDSINNERQPTGESVRPRPAILGPCWLPEYPKNPHN